jgi:hypothetical protein
MTRRKSPKALRRGGAELSQALAVAKLQSAKFFELQASISLTRLWCRQDGRGEARDLLAPIYYWFTKDLMRPS